MKYILSSSIFFLLLLPALLGQDDLPYVSGELIIQLAPDIGPEYAINKAEARSSKTFDCTYQSLAPSFNAWLLRFNSDEEALDMQALLILDDEIIHVQRNHMTSYRGKVPDDSLFNLQWQYLNTGQTGGTLDGDIDADDAWEITTGGLSPNGDTIVVAIIDDGLDLSHTDFGDNLWINYHEIPNNGIDDDSNGYVDDRRGWNSYDMDDDISGGTWGGWHGTPVAGIVGAQGDNQRGVTGVNWDVKLMIIVGGGSEADAISAYSYVLENRKLYESSGGSKGAYVVATNSSWGIDNGQPSQAPLWCAFYDTLGAYGILSAGATANSNVDIDVVGDLPTACPSDYLISVTNTNKYDQKVTQAGYGATTIDLGAPGADAYTVDHTLFSNGYGGFGGTSGATPHVAGAIALLYSVDCDSLADLSKSYPDSVALMMKDFILSGSDSIPSLDSITVSGGRLNLFGAIQQLQPYCSVNQSVPEEGSFLDEIRLYPNPAENEVHLSGNFDPFTTLISVKDIQGRHLENIRVTMNSNEVRMSWEDLPSGLYFVTIYGDKHRRTLKMLVR